MDFEQVTPSDLNPTGQFEQVSPNDLAPAAKKNLQQILAKPGPSQEFTPGFMDPSGHRYGSSEEEYQKETAGKNLFSDAVRVPATENH